MSDDRRHDPVALVEGQLQAYNDHDLDRFCAFFADDVAIATFPGGERGLGGMPAFRERYAARFADAPQVHCRIVQRMVLGRYVIDHEMISGAGPQPREVIAIYETGHDAIHRIWFVEE